jgi:hypothetical protein
VLDALVALVAGSLVLAGVIVIIGPRNVARTLQPLLRRPGRVPAVFESKRPREVTPSTINPKTQRVVVAAARLANWLRLHGHEDYAREIRGAAARLTGNEPAGLYALQNAMRRVRVVNISDSGSQERLKGLVTELRDAVQDRFEQLELLPFRKP